MKKHLLLLAVVLSALALNAKTLYLNTSNGWEDGGCNKFAVWQWADGQDGYFTDFMTQVKDHIWSVDVTENNLLFVRFNPDLSAPKWTENDDNSSWGQTCDLTLGDYDLYTPDMNWNNECSGFGGQWSTYDPNTDPGTNPGTNPGGGTTGTTGDFYLIGEWNGQVFGDGVDYKNFIEENKMTDCKISKTFTDSDPARSACWIRVKMMLNGGEGWMFYSTDDWQGDGKQTITLYSADYLYQIGHDALSNRWSVPTNQKLNITLKVINDHEIQLSLVDDATFAAHNCGEETAVDNVKDQSFEVVGGKIVSDADMRIFNIAGQDVTLQNGSLRGLYILQINGKAYKVIIK